MWAVRCGSIRTGSSDGCRRGSVWGGTRPGAMRSKATPPSTPPRPGRPCRPGPRRPARTSASSPSCPAPSPTTAGSTAPMPNCAPSSTRSNRSARAPMRCGSSCRARSGRPISVCSPVSCVDYRRAIASPWRCATARSSPTRAPPGSWNACWPGSTRNGYRSTPQRCSPHHLPATVNARPGARSHACPAGCGPSPSSRSCAITAVMRPNPPWPGGSRGSPPSRNGCGKAARPRCSCTPPTTPRPRNWLAASTTRSALRCRDWSRCRNRSRPNR